MRLCRDCAGYVREEELPPAYMNAPLNPKYHSLDFMSHDPRYEPLSKLLVSPLIAPIVVPYIIPYNPPLRSLDYGSYNPNITP